MSLQQLVILTAFGMLLLLAVSRVARVQRGYPPHLEGARRFLFIIAFLFVPPIALELLMNPTAAQGAVHGLESVLLYLIALGGFLILMVIAALVVRFVAPSRSRPILLLALVGSEGDADDVPFDPPVTAKLAESLALVERANAVFPRGREFPAQIDRAGFRGAWDALDAATGTLEGRIVDDRRLGVAVAFVASETAKDARSRLDTLRTLAIDHGQAWAT